MRLSLKLFVHRENMKAYAASLRTESRPDVRGLLVRLLAEETANGAVLNAEQITTRNC